jgi:hypothetical protein
MPTFAKACDIYQGFNFKKDVSTVVGFITALKINDVEIKADITCKDPLNPTTDLPVSMVLSDVNWGTGTTDALYFSGQVTVTNRQNLALMVYKDLAKVEVLFKYTVYEYDPVAKKYFKCFHCGDTEMKGILEKNGGDLNMSVADDASTQVQSPLNYAFTIGIKPQPIEQSLTIATADQKNVVKQWGVKQA